MNIYCTNPNCRYPENQVPDEFRNLRSHQQRYCSSCGMTLILKTRYLPSEQIGWGGFGKTFRAWDAHLQQLCVVKQLQPRNTYRNPFSHSELESIKKSFEEEARALRDIKHEQIPQLYDYFELPAPSDSQEEFRKELFYLVQEYVQGETLDKELNKKGRFSQAGKGIFPSSDLYSLAATCICLLTGRNINELWNQNRWIWREYVHVNDNLADILDRMLSYQPEDRYESAEQVIIVLSGQTSLNPNLKPSSAGEKSRSENQRESE